MTDRDEKINQTVHFGLVAQSVELRTFKASERIVAGHEVLSDREVGDRVERLSEHVETVAGNSLADPTDVVEDALAHAIRRAVDAGQWDRLGPLVRELDARRASRAAANVVDLAAERAKR